MEPYLAGTALVKPHDLSQKKHMTLAWKERLVSLWSPCRRAEATRDPARAPALSEGTRRASRLRRAGADSIPAAGVPMGRMDGQRETVRAMARGRRSQSEPAPGSRGCLRSRATGPQRPYGAELRRPLGRPMGGSAGGRRRWPAAGRAAGLHARLCWPRSRGRDHVSGVQRLRHIPCHP